MKAKTLGILAGITLVVIGAAAFLNQETTKPPARDHALVFPELMAKINDVTELTIKTKEETVTLVRQENTWSVKEKDHYPAAVDKVKRSLIGIAELRIREPKTKNPDLYEKLGLQDQSKAGARSTLVTIHTNENPEAAKLLIGDQRPAKGDPSLSEIYVRKPDDPQTWLVTGQLPLERAATEWLDQDILNITGTRVRRVRVMHPEGETLTIEKKALEDPDFQIADLPKGYKVQSQFNVNNVVTTLSKLTMDDVRKEEAIGSDGNAGVKAVLESFDGLQVTVQTIKKDETVYGKISAAFDPTLVVEVGGPDRPAAPESKAENEDQDQEQKGDAKGAGLTGATESPKPKIKSADEVKEEVAVLNKKFGGWVFELPTYRVDNFSKKKKDLITKES